MKTIADAHRIARTHRGRLKELFGAEIQLAPSPQDIVRVEMHNGITNRYRCGRTSS